jgi:hypothetical protein
MFLNSPLRHNLLVVSILFLTTVPLKVFSQKPNKMISLGLDFAQRDNLSGLGISMDYLAIVKRRMGFKIAVSGGPAWGKYQNDLSSSYNRNYIYDQMEGDIYISHINPETTDGGWYFSGSALMIIKYKSGAFIIGPRLNYFSGQEISALYNSEDSQYSYAGYAQMPYKKRVLLTGLELNLLLLDMFTLKYAIMTKQDNFTRMHTFGAAIRLTTL